MAVSCDLEVDVNGGETFMVHKKIVTSYSGRLSKLFSKFTGDTRNCKVIFNDFPGGPRNFELVSRFCYNNGEIDINPYNIFLLHSAAQFMEMDHSVSGTPNLQEKTEKALQEMNYWTWSELLVATRQCQDLLPLAICSPVLDKFMNSLTERMVLPSESSPCPSASSPDSFGFRFSSDTRSTESLKNGTSKANWWFDDLLILSTELVEMVIKAMVSQKVDHAIISRFLLYYQKSKFYTATSDQKCKILETVIDLLYTIDSNWVTCKSLFGILRVALSLDISKSSRKKLESMIGSQMDQATLDNLLIPSPYGTDYLYDVKLVLRLLKSFLRKGTHQVSPMRLQKVASLVDLYIAEVAPDPCLKPSKFMSLAMALPDSARDCYDEIYRAVDMYLQVHAGLSKEEKMKICCAINYEKLSAEVCVHISKNKRFPSKDSVQALVCEQFKLKSSFQSHDDKNIYGDSPSYVGKIGHKGKITEASEQIVLYAENVDLSTNNVKLREDLQGMQWRVMELEKVCKKMQAQMAKVMKSRVSSHSSARSLPRLCS
ncbi:hypothetical protein K2173_018649 [Erythroxylum novogranatense]|uniref:Phototropic-responsive NPH3 family protein n=1 Tax=Erythroxylum novogranatense TaxID=1862640 RepID=A0AAV8SAW3_9ROSI|nr:hypothetical protein K2173_018649 [Erythroxylum novogranatense]